MCQNGYKLIWMNLDFFYWKPAWAKSDPFLQLTDENELKNKWLKSQQIPASH